MIIYNSRLAGVGGIIDTIHVNGIGSPPCYLRAKWREVSNPVLYISILILMNLYGSAWAVSNPVHVSSIYGGI